MEFGKSMKEINMAMKPRRVAILLMAFMCANVSAFVSNFCHSTIDSAIQSKNYVGPFARSAALSASVDVASIPRKRRKRTAPANPKSKSKKFDEFQWLNWVYKQWRPVKPGGLTSEVLKQMEPAISRWGRRKTLNSADRAEELLERIIEENLAGNALAELTINLFNAAMDAHAKVGNPAGVQRILRRMETIRKENDHLSHLKPDVFSMSTLATAWAKSRSPEAAQKAEGILNYMALQELKPNVVTYNAILHALSVGNHIDKALRAEDLVHRMKMRHAATGENCKPDIYSYQSLIQAWSRTSLPGSPQRAEQILRFLDEQSKKGNKSLTPNSYCFTSKLFGGILVVWRDMDCVD
jgi:hypothetical protein